MEAVRPGGVVISAVEEPDQTVAARRGTERVNDFETTRGLI
jgi:hypothetical protein